MYLGFCFVYLLYVEVACIWLSVRDMVEMADTLLM